MSYCGGTAVAVRRRRRGESCRSFTCISPWFIFSRFFNGFYKSKNREERKLGNEKLNRDSDITRKIGIVNGSIKHEASSSSAADDSEIRKEEFFNLGVGFGLIYLAAASRNELNKLVDLHKKLELLLQNFQTEFQNQETEQHVLPCNSSIASCSKTGVQETLYHEEHDSGEYMSLNNDKFPEIRLSSERYRREKSLRMDQLEAELEAEFDRLHLQMDTEFYFKYSNHQHSEVNVEDSAPEESQSMIFEEVIEQPEYYSVPPIELERRLHELLESRHEERINELESALERAMHELREKERELSWWKDTARLVAQHLPAIPGLLMRHVKEPVHGNETRILSLEYEKSLV